MSANDAQRSAQVLGLIALTRMTAYARMARDVSQTTIFSDQLALARMGGAFVSAIDDLESYSVSVSVDLAEQTQPFVGFFDDLEARTRPADWWERIIKSYVLVGVLVDLGAVLGSDLGEDFTNMVGVAGAIGHDVWVRRRIGEALEAEPMLLARLSMWGRRVAGETLGAIQRLLVSHPVLLSPSCPSSQVLETLRSNHSGRMYQLGLTP